MNLIKRNCPILDRGQKLYKKLPRDFRLLKIWSDCRLIMESLKRVQQFNIKNYICGDNHFSNKSIENKINKISNARTHN